MSPEDSWGPIGVDHSPGKKLRTCRRCGNESHCNPGVAGFEYLCDGCKEEVRDVGP